MTSDRHKWGDPLRFAPEDRPSGCAQTERTCTQCGLVKVTVHPPRGVPWIEWRDWECREQKQQHGTPPCDRAAQSYAHCLVTWEANARRFPDLLEPYIVALVDNAATDVERLAIMRQGLAETFERRQFQIAEQSAHEPRQMGAPA